MHAWQVINDQTQTRRLDILQYKCTNAGLNIRDSGISVKRRGARHGSIRFMFSLVCNKRSEYDTDPTNAIVRTFVSGSQETK